MPSREQVLGLLEAGHGYDEIGRRLGVSPGQAFMVATGLPADGSDAPAPGTKNRPGWLPSSQHLSNPSTDNPTSKESVTRWMKARATNDTPMQAAAAEAKAKEA